MSFEVALSNAAASVPECVAAGYVDVASGMLLSLKTVDSHPQQVIDLLAAATADMFNGPNVSMIERMFKKARGLEDDGFHYFQEIIVNSENLIHVFLRGKTNPEYATLSAMLQRMVKGEAGFEQYPFMGKDRFKFFLVER